MKINVNELHSSRLLMWSLLGIFIVVTLYALGVRTLVPPDEGRYAEMAREMFVTGDWITTRLNGIKYFEKPPLQTWMNALSFAAFGLGEWQARLWTGLCGIIGVCMTAYAGKKVFGPRVGLYAGLVLASSLFWLASGQINSLDMGLSGMMTIVLMSLLIAQRDEAAPAERRNWMLLCWAGMALAVLAKGLIGVVLPGAVLVLYSLCARDWRIWTRLHLVKGLLVFFAIATPWFVLVALRNPEQPHFFFIHEHFQRFLMKGHKREGAWYYFLVLLIPGILPWIGVLPQSLAAAFKRQEGTFQPRLMVLIWALFITFFFSYSTSKLPGYIVPIFPALALLIALFLESASRRQRLFAAGLLCVLGAAILIGGPIAFGKASARDPAELTALKGYQPWLMAAGFFALAGGALALLHARQLRRDMTVLTIAGAGFLATHCILAGSELYGQNRAGTDMLPQIQAELTADTKLYSVGIYEQSLTYYLQRPVILVDYWDEFTFGLKQQPELSIPSIEPFITQWTNDANAGVHDMAIISLNRYKELQQRGVPMRVIAEDARRMVVANK
ncbi:glycosyltransferase family 39 protein [Janthinobacterium tructae]|uniref:Glycosyltransferase family 39 protein n=1 Tax=Janthinobacterium tructae TaxID=2590869 RepID=A0A4Y6RF05_9BURK|nr:glycosyltransferase family 39 protein [Janthinobacterium tructae]QDG70970.1 glycosyltransferase family 39 protein [Janthinobacterium tructae]